jgi:hypothetical protein
MFRRYGAFKEKMNKRQQEDLRIVLIGERGTGKTTFIDFIYKLCRGWKPQVHHESRIETKQIRVDGTTTHTIVYKGDVTKTIRILEIPLLEDTPKAILYSVCQESMSKVIEDELGTVHAIIMAVNGTQVSLNDTANQALRNISAMLPTSFSPNVGFLFTNCDPSTVNFDMKTLPKEYQESFSCFLQNPLPLLRKYEVAEAAGKTSKTMLGILKRNASRTFLESLDTLEELFDWMDSRTKQPARFISDLCDRLKTIRSIALKTVSQMSSAMMMRNEIKELQTRIGELDQVRGIISSEFIGNQI